MKHLVNKLSAYLKGTYSVTIPIFLITILAKVLVEGSPTFTMYPLYIRALATIGYVIGFSLDQWTTHKCFALKSHFEGTKYEWDIVEANIFLPANPTLRQQLISIPTLGALAISIYVFLDPLVGFGGAVFHLWAAYDNNKLCRQALGALNK